MSTIILALLFILLLFSTICGLIAFLGGLLLILFGWNLPNPKSRVAAGAVIAILGSLLATVGDSEMRSTWSTIRASLASDSTR